MSSLLRYKQPQGALGITVSFYLPWELVAEANRIGAPALGALARLDGSLSDSALLWGDMWVRVKRHEVRLYALGACQLEIELEEDNKIPLLEAEKNVLLMMYYVKKERPDIHFTTKIRIY